MKIKLKIDAPGFLAGDVAEAAVSPDGNYVAIINNSGGISILESEEYASFATTAEPQPATFSTTTTTEPVINSLAEILGGLPSKITMEFS